MVLSRPLTKLVAGVALTLITASPALALKPNSGNTGNSGNSGNSGGSSGGTSGTFIQSLGQAPNLSLACGGIAPNPAPAYNLCFSLTSWTFAGASNTLGANQVQFTLANLTNPAYGPTRLDEFLISGLGSAYGVTNITGLPAGNVTFISGLTANSLGYNGAGLTGGQRYVGFDYNGNAGILQGTSAVVTMTFDKSVVDTDFEGSSMQFAAHVQGSNVGTCASTKAVFNEDGTRANGAVDYDDVNTADCVPDVEEPPTTTTPEPASLALLGTGLLAIGGMAVRRRRQS